MTTTIELAKEAGFDVDHFPVSGNWLQLQEAFRALCVAERDKELMKTDMEPVVLVGSYKKWHTPEQLAATRLQGAEEERNRFVEANKDPLTELYFARKEIEELKQAGAVNQGLLDIAYEVANAMPVNASQHIVRIGTVEAARAAIAAAEQEKTK